MLKLIPVFEKFLLFLLLIGIILNFFSDEFMPVITISLTGFSILFFLNAFQPINIPPNEHDELMGFTQLFIYVIIPKILGISASIVTVGILFYILDLNEDSYLSMITIGFSTLSIGVIVLFVGKAMGTKHIDLIFPVLYRYLPVLLIGFYLLLKIRGVLN